VARRAARAKSASESSHFVNVRSFSPDEIHVALGDVLPSSMRHLCFHRSRLTCSNVKEQTILKKITFEDPNRFEAMLSRFQAKNALEWFCVWDVTATVGNLNEWHVRKTSCTSRS